MTKIENSENVVSGSSFENVKGDVHVGDKIWLKIKQNKGLIFIGLVLLFGIGIDHKNEIILLLKLDRHFTENDQDFKIIILPFKEYCKDNGKNYDAGLVIKNRLNGIIQKDTLKVKTWYWENFDFQDFNNQKAEKMRKYHFADMIIYGTYQTASCSAEGNQICLNFITDPKWNLNQAGFDLDKENFIQGGLDELKKGKIQEQVENIAIFVSVLAQIKNIDHKKYFAKLQGLLQKDVDSNLQGYIYHKLADQLFVEIFFGEALKNYNKALEIYKNGNDEYQITLVYNKITVIYDIIYKLDKKLKDNYKLFALHEIAHKVDSIPTYSPVFSWKWYMQTLLFPTGSIDTVWLSNLALEQLKLGNFNEAILSYKENCQLIQQSEIQQNYRKDAKRILAYTYFQLYHIYLVMNQKKNAKKSLAQAVEILKRLKRESPSEELIIPLYDITEGELAKLEKQQLKTL